MIVLWSYRAMFGKIKRVIIHRVMNYICQCSNSCFNVLLNTMGVGDLWGGRQTRSKQTLVVHLTSVLKNNINHFLHNQFTVSMNQPVFFSYQIKKPFPVKVRIILLRYVCIWVF